MAGPQICDAPATLQTAMARVYAQISRKRRLCRQDDLVEHGFSPDQIAEFWPQVQRDGEVLLSQSETEAQS